MENSEKSILVPWDFSEHSYYALENAVEISRTTKYNIDLLHIIASGSKEAEARERMEKVVREIEDKFQVKPGYLIKIGTVFETVKEVANSKDYSIAVMKTDGVKGMQRFVGSNAIKIICGSKIPFLVVQQSANKDGFKKLLYPIDYRIENKQILSYITYLRQFNDFKLVLMKPFTNDKLFKKNINNTVNLAKVILDSKNISYEVFTAGQKGDYATQIIEYARIKECDMILIQVEKNLTFTKFLFGVKEQKIIANPYKIPVMCLSPKVELTKYTGFH